MTFVFKRSFAGVIAPKSEDNDNQKHREYTTLGEAHHYWQHAVFVQSGKHERQKEIRDLVNLVAAIKTE
jgi:hypothetical protein